MKSTKFYRVHRNDVFPLKFQWKRTNQQNVIFTKISITNFSSNSDGISMEKGRGVTKCLNTM